MKWITAIDLNKWAETKDAQQYLPELVEKLIYSSVKDVKSFSKLRVPIGDKTYLSGFDVDVDSNETIYLVGSGHSVWEIGTNLDPKIKAEEDFNKRIVKKNIDKANTIYVFVTPRSWSNAQIWADEKKKLGIWKNVCVFTDVELEQWLDNCPAAALWLSERLKGTFIANISDIESYWNKWCSNGNVQIPVQMIIGGREEQLKIMADCFHSPSIKMVSAVSKDEALAFSVAACMISDKKQKTLCHSVVVTSDDMMKVALEKYEGLIIIADVNKRDYGYAINRKNTIIYVAGPDDKLPTTETIVLPRIEREAFVQGLMVMGKSEVDARIIMRGSMRDIAIVRRRFLFDLSIPLWVRNSDTLQCCTMMLLGMWNEERTGDKAIIRALAGDDNRFLEEANRLRVIDDAPIVNVGGKWRLKSYYDIFSVLARYITVDMLDKYKSVVIQCLNDLDPEAVEKASATKLYFWKEKRQYSMWLKEGLLHTAILIALYGEPFELPANYNQEWIDNILTELLDKANLQWWISNRHLITLIAEASPESFIKTLKKRLKSDDNDLRTLFEIGTGLEFGSGIQYAEILWALESLAWDEQYLRDVTDILLQMCDFNTPKNYSNKPVNSLEAIYKVWYPQTNASNDIKKKIFIVLGKKHRAKMFELCFQLINGVHCDIGENTAHFKMRYIDTNHDIKDISWKEVVDVKIFLTNFMIELCNDSDEELEKLLEIATDTFRIPYVIRTKLIDSVDTIKDRIQGHNLICDKIRQSLIFNESLSDSQRKLQEGEVVRLQSLLKYLEPKDIKERNMWLFSKSSNRMVALRDRDWEKSREELIKKRADMLKMLSREEVFLFSTEVEDPSTVGAAYFRFANSSSDFLTVIGAWHDGKVDERFATEYIAEWGRNKKIDSLISEIRKFKDKYSEELVKSLLVCSGFKETITLVDELPEECQREFWTKINVYGIGNDNVLHTLDKLIEYGCFCNALFLTYLRHDDIVIPNDTLTQIIEGILATGDIKSGMGLELSTVLVCIDLREGIDVNIKYQYELLFHKIIKAYPHKDKYALEKAMESDYEFMYSLICFTYKNKDSSYTENKKIIQKAILNILEFETPACPFYDNGKVDSDNLNKYVDGIRKLAKKDGLVDTVDYFLGKLFAKSVGKDSIPKAVCEIIDRIDSDKINNSFNIKIFNMNAFTVRGPYEGGTVERSKYDRFKKIADDINIEYPVTASIFYDLCKQYNREALRMDEHAELTEME